MILFQSVTVSAHAVELKTGASAIVTVRMVTQRKSLERLMGFDLSLGLRYDERTSLSARRPSAGAMPGR
jgi:hypothetical protein